jgi:predicted nucleic acid-binding protein
LEIPLLRYKSIVADSTFYLCFLDDIKRPDCLVIVLKNFTFYLPRTVVTELSISEGYNLIKNHVGTVEVKDNYNYSEILTPFFSKKQIKKGEAEAVALAHIFYRTARCDKLILDDGEARSFVASNLPELAGIMIGTVGFIGDCYCVFGIYSKEEAIKMLYQIGQSKFRIKDKDLSKIKQRIEDC